MDGLHAPVVTTSVPDEINRRLLELITERQLNSGDRLPPERELAHSLGVSRATLRDALRSLTERGVLQSKQGSGWFVRLSTTSVVNALALHLRLSDMTLRQMIEARRVLEPSIARYAALRRTRADMEAIDGVYAAMVNANDAEYTGLDEQLHMLIGVSSHNPFFSLAVEPMFELMPDLRSEVLKLTPNSRARSFSEHRDLVEAIRMQNEHEAYAAMARHLDSFFERAAPLLDMSVLPETGMSERSDPDGTVKSGSD